MSEEQKQNRELECGGYQAKIDKPLKNPPTGGSNVKKPPSSEQKN